MNKYKSLTKRPAFTITKFPNLPCSFAYTVSLQFLASSTTVQSASWCTCRRVIKLFHRYAPYMQYLIPPKHSHLLAHIHTRLLHLVGLKLFLEIRFPQNRSLFACCHSRIVSGIEYSLHDFFSFLSIYIFRVLVF